MSDLNDPRVLFAAERTLLAWSRTGISLMVFGFVIERFGIFLELAKQGEVGVFQRYISFFIGESFVILAVLISIYSVWQHIRVIRTLQPAEIPEGYGLYGGIIVNVIVAGLGLVLCAYLAISYV
jgi:putative membrane protein